MEFVPCRKVATLLRAHGTKLAVLNACDSARGNKGIEANLARVFTQEGISNALAMSFKLQSSAAVLFVKSFYRDLLLRQRKFAQAARSA